MRQALRPIPRRRLAQITRLPNSDSQVVVASMAAGTADDGSAATPMGNCRLIRPAPAGAKMPVSCSTVVNASPPGPIAGAGTGEPASPAGADDPPSPQRATPGNPAASQAAHAAVAVSASPDPLRTASRMKVSGRR